MRVWSTDILFFSFTGTLIVSTEVYATCICQALTWECLGFTTLLHGFNFAASIMGDLSHFCINCKKSAGLPMLRIFRVYKFALWCYLGFYTVICQIMCKSNVAGSDENFVIILMIFLQPCYRDFHCLISSKLSVHFALVSLASFTSWIGIRLLSMLSVWLVPCLLGLS